MRLILLNLVLAIISSFVAAYLVLTRKYLRARLMAFIVIGASIWAFGYAMEMYYVVAETKLFWANVQFIGMALTNVVPLSVLHFYDKEDWLTKRNVSLALAVKQTIEKHGGVIEVESEKGVGTEFIIRIPEDSGHMGMSDTRLNSISIT
jgi:hypothetical protein